MQKRAQCITAYAFQGLDGSLWLQRRCYMLPRGSRRKAGEHIDETDYGDYVPQDRHAILL